MAFENFIGVSPAPFKAGGTVAQYRAVKLDSTAGQVVASTAEGDLTIGASINSAASGEHVGVQSVGYVKLTAGAAINLGAEVEATSDGKVITAGGASARSLGVACEAAAADGDIITVLLSTPTLKGPANS